MLEYLIRRTDDDWFTFPSQRYGEILRPIRAQSRRVEGWGNNRIDVDGEEISFSDEDLGFQVVFETGVLSEEKANQIVTEICENIEAQTGQRTRIVKL